MAKYRRILRAFWFTAAFSIILSVAMVATSVMDKTCPVFAATGADSAAEEKVVEPPDETSEAPHPRIAARVKGSQDTDIESETRKVKLHVPKGAVNGEAEIQIVEHGQCGPDGSGILNVIELNAFPVELGSVIATSKIRQFAQPLTISITHEPQELAGLDVDTLTLCFLDEKSERWVPLADSNYDPETGVLTATTNHFSYYGEVANPTILGPGKVMAYLVDLHSGAATSEYAIEVPPGSGGFQPSIVLRHSSASVDEMKNKRDVGSWVGIGWSLGLGSISCMPGSGKYSLSLDGATWYELVQDAQGGYHTNPESFFKITRTGQQWDVYDREGRYYQFGGDLDSQQYVDDSVYYRWDISSIVDTNTSNAIKITYVQDLFIDSSGKTHIRSAYPSHVSYNGGLVDIQFNSSHDTNEAVYGPLKLRKDNPQFPAPKVVENRRLDAIEVKVDGGLVRRYAFTYDTTDDHPAYEGSSDYYAGTHTLASITEYGSDNVTHLPDTTFTYSSDNEKHIYHYDDDQIPYNGNPGNPAQLSWPYLVTVSNGYGATVTYSYTELPEWNTEQIWTRQIVTGRVVNPGIGAQQTYSYQYYDIDGNQGEPDYLKVGPGDHGWNDEFRGFSRVRETDAQGGYTEHYFHTIGAADFFTGREYKTEWYDINHQLLETKEYTWDYRYTVGGAPPLGDGAVGYWDFDENGGQIACDDSGNGYDGFLGWTEEVEASDPSWTTGGAFGSALTFDGENDFVYVANGASLDLTTNFTLSAWVFPTSEWPGGQIITRRGSSGSFYAYALSNVGSSIIYSQNYNVSGSECEYLYASEQAPLNKWTHVAVVYNDKAASIYINGQLSGSRSFQQNPVPTPNGSLEIGCNLIQGGWFKGRIDDVRIYNRPLSGAEVMSHPLVAAYNFDEDLPGVTGQNNRQIDDVSGCGNYGIAKSTASFEWTNGISGSAITFSGDDWIEVLCLSNLHYLDMTDDFTLEAWVYPTADALGGIITRGKEDLTSYEVWYQTDQRVTYQQNWGSAGGPQSLSTPENSVPLNQWTHIAVAYNDHSATIFVNGKASVSGSFSANPVVVDGGYFEMGCNHPGSDEFYRGRIDNVRIYQRAMSGEEVLSHAATVAYDFNDDTPGVTGRTSAQIADVSGSANGGAAGSFSSGAFEWANGVTGSAMVFNGDDWVKMPNTALNGLTDFTFECWINTTASGDGIITAATASQSNEFLVYNQGSITPYVKGSSVSTGISVNDGKWHHLAVTRSAWGELGGMPKVKVYKDGALAYTWSGAPPGPLTVDPNGLWLGQEQDSVGSGWDLSQGLNGTLDGVRIYARVLSQEEVRTHAALAAYSFNEGAGGIWSTWGAMTSGTTNILYGVWGISGSDVFAVGASGTVLHYNGSAWSAMSSGTTTTLQGVWGTSTSDVFAVGLSGVIRHYNGSAWSPMTSGTTSALRAVWGTAWNDVFAVGDSGVIRHYDGYTWSAMTSGTTNSLRAVWGTSASDVFAAGLYGVILHYDGNSWSAMNSGSTAWFFGLWGEDSNNVFCVGSNGAILHYDGATWTTMSSGTTSHMRAVWGTSASDVFATGDSGVILHYDGSTWSAMGSGATSNLWGVYGFSALDVFAVGESGVIRHWEVGGGPWSAMDSGTTGTLRGVWGHSSQGLLSVGDSGVIRYYNGLAWSTMDSGTTNNLEGVWGSITGHVFVVGAGGTILSYDGSVWSDNISGTTSALRAVWGTAWNDVFAVGDSGVIRHYDGNSWSGMSSGVTTSLRAVWGTSASDVFAAGLYGVILHYDGNPENLWSVMNSGSTEWFFGLWGEYTWGEPSTDAFCVGSNGTILHYDGATWSAMSSGTTSHMRAVWGTYTDVFATGDSGVILHYDGSAWSAMSSGATSNLWGVYGTSALDVFAVGESGVIRHYEGNTAQVYDASGLGHNGMAKSNATFEWVSGRNGVNVTDSSDTALYFSGDDWVEMPATGAFDLTTDFTIEAWVYPTADTWGGIVARGRADAGSYELWHETGNRVSYRHNWNAATGSWDYQLFTTNDSVPLNQWSRIAVVYTNNYVTIYINGQPAASGAPSTNPVVVDGGWLEIGCNHAGGSPASYEFFRGRIDDVRIYSSMIGDRYDGSEIVPLATVGPSSAFVYLEEETDTVGSKVSRTRYEYDDYGNVSKVYQDGDPGISTDDSVIERTYYPNESANILSRVAIEKVKDGSGATKQETLYYYDGHNDSVAMPPDVGNLTRVEQKKDAGSSISTYCTYDDWGNVDNQTDPNGNVWDTDWEGTYHAFPEKITSPIISQYETYEFDPRTGNLEKRTDVNSENTTYLYDTFGRLTKVIKPGDNSTYPTVEYQYPGMGDPDNDWGVGEQHLKTLTKITDSDYLWQSQYFDGLGRVIQVQAQGESGRTIIDSTTVYNNRGLVGMVYVSQDVPSPVNGYVDPAYLGWKYASYQYDALGRGTSATAADGTTTHTSYSEWRTTVTNPKGNDHKYDYDAFGRLTKVEEMNGSSVYATTDYTYDVLGNLTKVEDAGTPTRNTTTMTYDWLSRKTAMTDPDMGNWSYGYDNNGNLTTQTDAKGQTTTFTYDSLNRLTGKTYPAGSGMPPVTYEYDSTSGGNCGIGRRTGMTDASGASYWKYDERGRVVQEKRIIDSVDYVTGYSYDSADRVATITYPTLEVVEQTYNGRGLPDGVSGDQAGDLVTQTLYNQLGSIKQINLGNGTTTVFNYQGLDAGAPTTYYGRLWEIKTTKDSTVLQDMKYTWDANGNLTQREDVVADETETFTYDFLDRLTGVSGEYSNSYTYDKIGNITTFNGNSYTYGSKPHAVTAVSSTSYAYDANGNMTARGTQTLTWDVENRLIQVTDSATPPTEWEQEYGGTYSEGAYSVQQTSDGGYIMVGYTSSLLGTKDVWLVRTDASGNKLWDKTFGGDYDDVGYSVQQTSDGGYIITGRKATGIWYGDVWLIKTDSSGNEQWNKTFGDGSYEDVGYSVQQTSDGGYIIAGRYGSNNGQVYLIKTNSSGTSQWSKTFGGSSEDIGYSAQQTSDGGYIIAGCTKSYGAGNNDVWLIKTDSSGNNPLYKTFGGTSDDVGRSVWQTSDGGYVIGGYTQSYGEGINDAWLIKTDSDRNEEWNQTFGGSYSEYGYSVQQTFDGGYVMAGEGYTGLVYKDVYLVRVGPSAQSYMYDGDGNRVKKISGQETVLYINQYYEKNLATGVETTHYYLGGREVAYRNGTTLEYLHQDYLGSTVLTTNSSGATVATIAYFPFGGTRSASGGLNTDKMFTGQTLDQLDLYYYGARYYDPGIGRFISADTMVPDPADPQLLNRYAYCRNNPLVYTDPTGHESIWHNAKANFKRYVQKPMSSALTCVSRKTDRTIVLQEQWSISLIVQFTWTMGFATDPQGNVGFLWSGGVGFTTNAGIALQEGALVTTAETIDDLRGEGYQAGGSVGAGVAGMYVDYVEPENGAWSGVEGMAGGGLSVSPYDLHVQTNWTGVHEIYSGESDTTETPPATITWTFTYYGTYTFNFYDRQFQRWLWSQV